MRIGKVISSQITENRDGESKVLLLQVEISDPDDVQTVEYAQAAGEDFNPPPGSTVIVTDLGEAWKIAIAADDGIEPSSLPGERVIYSSAGGTIMALIKLFADGKIRIENSLGYMEMAVLGQVDINGNFTVDP